MEQRHKSLLLAKRFEITSDLRFRDVRRHLLDSGVLNGADLDEIESAQTREDQAKALLDILPTRGSNAFAVFRDALQHRYPHLAMILNDGPPTDRERKEPRVFVIHAGEDKGSFVSPLFAELQQQGLAQEDIFFDEVSIKPGDIIRDRIISALSSQTLELAVVVVSTSLLNKPYWPKLEFETCLKNNKRIFPIWLDENSDNFKAFSELVGKYSPTLKQVSARRILRGHIPAELPSIAAEIVQQLSEPRDMVQAVSQGFQSQSMIPSEYTVLMVGMSGSGKSSLGNSILGLYGRDKAFEEFDPMASQHGSPCCQKSSALVDTVLFHVIDTPGLGVDVNVREIQFGTLVHISTCREFSPDGVNALLLVIPFRQKFTKKEETAIFHLKTLFGDELLKYGIIIFTDGDRFEEAKENGEIDNFNAYLQSQPQDFIEVLQKVGKRYVLFNNKLRGDAATPQRLQLVEKIQEVMKNVGGKAYKIPKITKAEDVTLCFPATSTVLMDGNHPEKMASLQLGTTVLSITDDTTPATLDTVYFFSHTADDVIAPFVSITTVSGKTLHLSEGHYIYLGTDALKTGALVTAREVKVGDVVHVVDGPDQTPHPEEVTEVKTEIKRGLYCPHTLGGSLVVDGVCVSTYTEMFPPTVAHGLLWPIRVLYRFAPEMAGKIAQPQGEKGMPTWLGWLHDRYMAWV